jgi:hypothetical protein
MTFLALNADIQQIMQSLLHTRPMQSQDLQDRFEALTKSQKIEHAKTRPTFFQMEGDKNIE